VCARAHARTHVHERTRTFALTRAGGACCGVRERGSAAGTSRSVGPLAGGTRTWWRRCSRTAPMRTRRPRTGAAAGRYFRRRSACCRAGRGRPGRHRCNAVLDAHRPTHEHARTHEWKDACCACASVYLPSYAYRIAPSYAYGSACTCAHTRARTRSLEHDPQSDERTHTHAHAGASTHPHACARTRTRSTAQ
jgi:hypothetical protein